VAFGGALLVSFGLAALNSVLPLRQTIRQEALDDLHDSAAILLERVEGYLGQRCADMRTMAALLGETRVNTDLGMPRTSPGCSWRRPTRPAGPWR
jgi:hypothetical protein